MTPLSEVAADVAQALGLEILGSTLRWITPYDPLKPDEGVRLYFDGSNITEDYWRCRCEDWLIDQGWVFTAAKEPFAVAFDEEPIVIACPWPEAPARLVSAAYRKMQEETE